MQLAIVLLLVSITVPNTLNTCIMFRPSVRCAWPGLFRHLGLEWTTGLHGLQSGIILGKYWIWGNAIYIYAIGHIKYMWQKLSANFRRLFSFLIVPLSDALLKPQLSCYQCS